MDTPFDHVLKLTNDLATITTQTTLVLKRVIELEEKTIIQQGLIEICLGLVASKYGKDELIDFLKFISTSQSHSKEAKLAASVQLQQEALWGGLLKKGIEQ